MGNYYLKVVTYEVDDLDILKSRFDYLKQRTINNSSVIDNMILFNQDTGEVVGYFNRRIIGG